MRLRDRTSAVLGCAAVLVAVLAVGGALWWAQAIVAGLLGIALIPQVRSRRVFDRKSPLVVAICLAAGFTAIQLVPLPELLLRSVNPVAMGLRADGAALFGVSPWNSISLDAAGSIRGVAFFISLLAVAVLALRLSVSERGRFLVIAGVTGTIGICAVVVGVHAVFAATSLYGLYEPVQAAPTVLGPLLNANHLGGLMAVGAVSSIGLILYQKQPSWMRASWVMTLLACATITVLTLSRGATIALAAGSLITLGVLVGQRFATAAHSRHRRARLAMSTVPIGIVVTCTVLVVILINAGGVQKELARSSLQEIDQPTSKYSAWKSSTQLVDEAPWVGVGRGGFEPAFTRVHPASGFVTFSHLENEYLQAVVDWGIPAALCLGVVLLWFAVAAIRRWRDGPLAAAALGAIVVVGLQSNFDFGVEILGLAVPITALAATLVYVPIREGERRQLAIGRGLRIAHIALLGVAAAVLVTPMATSIGEDHADFEDRADVTYEELRDAAERHPLDYYLYARGASILAGKNDPKAIKLLNHALRLHPTHSGLHRMAGHLLLASGHPDQAALEYAAALRATKAPQKLIEEILQRFPKEKAAASIPPDFADLDLVVKTLRDLGHPEIATAWLKRVLAANPKDVHACEMLYTIALRENNLEAAETAGRSCVEIVPDRTTRFSLAKVMIVKKSYTEVIRLLEDVESWPGRIDDKVAAWFLLCDAHEGLKHWDDAKRCVRYLEVSGYLTPAQRPRVNKQLERIEQGKRDSLPSLDGSGAGSGSGSGSAAKPATKPGEIPKPPTLPKIEGAGSGSAK